MATSSLHLTDVSTNFAETSDIVPDTIDEDQPFGLAGFILVTTGKKIKYLFPKAVYERNTQVPSHSHVLRNVFAFKIDGISRKATKDTPRRLSGGFILPTWFSQNKIAYI
jgi:hypothetical protein